MKTYDQETHIVYLKAQRVAETAHSLFILKGCEASEGDTKYERKELVENYQDLQRAMIDAGLI